MENEKRAMAIDEANIGKLVQYHLNGWRFGTLAAVTPENVRIKKIAGGHDVTVALDDVRLVIEEAEKPKAIHLSADGTPSKAAKALKDMVVALHNDKPENDKAARKSGKPEKTTMHKVKITPAKPAIKRVKVKIMKPKGKKNVPPKDVNFDVARIVRLYDKGKGKSVSEIAQAIGYPKGKGNNRVANALIKAGVFKGTRTQQ